MLFRSAHCIIRRELFSSGKSRAFINDSPVQLQQLRGLTGNLIDIHSQHHNLLLGESSFQLKVIDIISGNENLLSQYKEYYNSYKRLESELRNLKEELSKSLEEADYLKFQFNQLEEAKLKENEQEELEEELKTLSNVEDIKAYLFAINSILDNNNTGGVVSSLKDASQKASSLRRIFNKAEEIFERLENLRLKDEIK